MGLGFSGIQIVVTADSLYKRHNKGVEESLKTESNDQTENETPMIKLDPFMEQSRVRLQSHFPIIEP